MAPLICAISCARRLTSVRVELHEAVGQGLAAVEHVLPVGGAGGVGGQAADRVEEVRPDAGDVGRAFREQRVDPVGHAGKLLQACQLAAAVEQARDRQLVGGAADIGDAGAVADRAIAVVLRISGSEVDLLPAVTRGIEVGHVVAGVRWTWGSSTTSDTQRRGCGAGEGLAKARAGVGHGADGALDGRAAGDRGDLGGVAWVGGIAGTLQATREALHVGAGLQGLLHAFILQLLLQLLQLASGGLLQPLHGLVTRVFQRLAVGLLPPLLHRAPSDPAGQQDQQHPQ
ncbi:hypothetical protein G6F23_012775 [Rhizopus arrhizus]|nr:hypothetical protein G6F23_012775 [Rhizopus arrhizus]